MTQAIALVNNGLPEGIHFKDIEIGDVVYVKFPDLETPILMLITENEGMYKRKTYKGYIAYRGLQIDLPSFNVDPNERYRISSFESDMVTGIYASYKAVICAISK